MVRRWDFREEIFYNLTVCEKATYSVESDIKPQINNSMYMSFGKFFKPQGSQTSVVMSSNPARDNMWDDALSDLFGYDLTCCNEHENPDSDLLVTVSPFLCQNFSPYNIICQNKDTFSSTRFHNPLNCEFLMRVTFVC